MPRLDVDHRHFVEQADRLSDLVSHLTPMEPRYQKLVVEIAMLRLFSLVESTIESIAVKALCGARYLDSSLPLVIQRSRSAQAAITSMENYGRGKKRILRWTKSSEIKDNIAFVINGLDPINSVLDSHGMILDEMRKVRNRIAHSTGSARQQFRHVVLRRYGAYVNSVTPGTLLISDRFTPRMIDDYLRSSKVIIRELVLV